MEMNFLCLSQICLSLGCRSIKTVLDLSVLIKSAQSSDWDRALTVAFDLLVLRITVLWQLGQHEAAGKLISEADAAARGSGDGWCALVNESLSLDMCQTLSTKLLDLAIQEIKAKKSSKGGVAPIQMPEMPFVPSIHHPLFPSLVVLDMLDVSLGLTLHALTCPAAEPPLQVNT